MITKAQRTYSALTTQLMWNVVKLFIITTLQIVLVSEKDYEYVINER